MKNAMKNNGLMLLAVAITVTSVTGCGCCRRLRDTLCRGAYCGAPAAALPAPLAPPMVSPAPLADVGCGFNPVAYDAGCGFDPMVQTYGYNGFPAGGQMMGSPMVMDGGCPNCVDGSYALPSYDTGGSYLVDPGTTGSIDPGPAN
ncbi:MAG: hypothetical protein AAFV43_02550 [Planctomycetota bacterium]